MSDKYTLPPYVLSRVRYYDGQFLTDDDFIDEQKYHLDRLWRHERLTNAAGISEGLEVSLAMDQNTLKLKVSAGTAVDGMGRQILLSADRLIAIDPSWDGIQWMTIRYQEMEDRHAEDNPTTGGVGGNTRFTANPVIEIVPSLTAIQDKYPVALSQVTFAAGVQPVLTPARTYSGLRLPGPGGAASTLRARQAGGTELGTSLSVTGDLEASGNLKYGGTLSKLDIAETPATFVRAYDFTFGSASRRGSPGRAFVDLKDTLTVNYASDWPKLSLQGKDGIFLETSVATIPGGELRVSGKVTGADIQANGNLGYTGTLSKLDVAENAAATVRTADFLIGHSTRRGSPGRALVDVTDSLTVNYASDWPKLWLQGKDLITLDSSSVAIPAGNLSVSGNLTMKKSLILLGKTDGGAATSQEILGGIGFLGWGVQHAELAFRAGKGFEFVDCSATTPSLSYDTSPRYADVYGGKFTGTSLSASGDVQAGANLGYTGTLSKLDVAENGGAIVRCYDFNIGHSARRGSPGRAFVDLKDTLAVNYASDWPKLSLQGKDLISLESGSVAIPGGNLRVNGDLTMAKSVILLGRTDGSRTANQEILGALGFLGVGVQHAQLAFRAGRGFEFVDVSATAPNLSYPDRPPYADVYARIVYAALNNSDIELKRDIQVVEGAMAKLRQLRGVSFRWKDETLGTERQLGVIAQEVEALFPELVHQPRGMPRFVHYEKFVPVLIQALKEQDERIAQLEARLAARSETELS